MKRLILLALLALVATPAAEVYSQQRATYQRYRNAWSGGPVFEGHYQNPRPPRGDHHYSYPPQKHYYQHGYPQQPYGAGYSSGSYFQRPYPYHLDYYRMRYGGSYAPYYGNLYGPPQVYAPSNVYAPAGPPPVYYPPQAPAGNAPEAVATP